MKKYNKTLYYSRIITFLLQFYLVFMITGNILQVGILGLIFLFIYLVYVFRVLQELISKKEKYKNDLIYNLMQIGLFIYLGVIVFKIYHDHMMVLAYNYSYFVINFVILNLLICFILIYSFFELSKRK